HDFSAGMASCHRISPLLLYSFGQFRQVFKKSVLVSYFRGNLFCGPLRFIGEDIRYNPYALRPECGEIEKCSNFFGGGLSRFSA
ncbi:MAG TPA: hypothetical protein VGF13_14700, partial [Verrucomicrobiae bacterium]